MKRLSLAVGLLLAGMTGAQAADSTVVGVDEGGYFGLAAGVNLVTSGSAKAPARTPQDLTFHFHLGPALSISGGYKWVSGLRAELEGSYRRNGAEDFNSSATPLSGHQDDLSLMANVLHDFHSSSRITPYVGVGAGIAMVSWRDFANASSRQIVHEPGGTRFALQAILGAAYAVAPGLDFTLDGRFKGSSGHNFTGYLASDSITSYSLREVSVMAGLRYKM